MGSLPTVVVSSVVRSTDRGESHGGVYLVDLASGDRQRVVDWDDPSISWEGRGFDRGLRGIAFHDDHVILSASDEIFVYDQAFRKLSSFKNPYLRHCHEIAVEGDRLYLTSTYYDSILEMDLLSGRFVAGYCLRHRVPKWLHPWLHKAHIRIAPAFHCFDPETHDGPEPADTIHLNSVVCRWGATYFSGTRLDRLYRLRDGVVSEYAEIPFGTHNAQPVEAGEVLFNHTREDRILRTGRDGSRVQSFSVPTYPSEELEHDSLPEDHARQGFGRGLCLSQAHRLLVAGSSPATISVYDLDEGGAPLKSVNLTMDVRNAVHGLEIWPFLG